MYDNVMSSLALVSMMVLALNVGVVWVSLTRRACNFEKGKTLVVSHALYNSKYRKLIISLSWVTAILFALSLDKFHWDTVLIAISFFCFGLSYVIRKCWGHFLVIHLCSAVGNQYIYFHREVRSAESLSCVFPGSAFHGTHGSRFQ